MCHVLQKQARGIYQDPARRLLVAPFMTYPTTAEGTSAIHLIGQPEIHSRRQHVESRAEYRHENAERACVLKCKTWGVDQTMSGT
jgi:hypothetical protein